MFTGIITDIGRVRTLSKRGDLRARITTGYDTARIDIGASIACDGVCLTVVATGIALGFAVFAAVPAAAAPRRRHRSSS